MLVANPPAGPGRELVRFPTSPTSYAALDGVSELDYRRRRARATRSAGPVRNPAVLGDGVLGGGTATFHPLRQRRPARVMAWVADLSRRPGPSRALDVLSRCLRHQVHDVGYFGPGTFEQFPP